MRELPILSNLGMASARFFNMSVPICESQVGILRQAKPADSTVESIVQEIMTSNKRVSDGSASEKETHQLMVRMVWLALKWPCAWLAVRKKVKALRSLALRRLRASKAPRQADKKKPKAKTTKGKMESKSAKAAPPGALPIPLPDGQLH